VNKITENTDDMLNFSEQNNCTVFLHHFLVNNVKAFRKLKGVYTFIKLNESGVAMCLLLEIAKLFKRLHRYSVSPLC